MVLGKLVWGDIPMEGGGGGATFPLTTALVKKYYSSSIWTAIFRDSRSFENSSFCKSPDDSFPVASTIIVLLF